MRHPDKNTGKTQRSTLHSNVLKFGGIFARCRYTPVSLNWEKGIEMNRRSWTAAILALFAFAAVLASLATTQPSLARADVCASVGRRVSVGGCTNVADNIAKWAPPPAAYAPLPEDEPPPPPP